MDSIIKLVYLPQFTSNIIFILTITSMLLMIILTIIFASIEIKSKED